MFIGIVAGLVASIFVLYGYKYFLKRDPSFEYYYFSVESFLDSLKRRTKHHDMKIILTTKSESAYEIVTSVMKSSFYLENISVTKTDSNEFRYEFVLRYKY